MRLVFLGSGAFGLPTLERLAAEHDVGLVVTQPDRPAGRRLAPSATPIARWAEDRGLDRFKPDRVNAPESVERIRAAEAAAYVVIAYGNKLGSDLLHGVCAINLHASLLPKYRGAAPINWAVINQDPQTGVSVITVAERMDSGDILAQQATPIDPMETAGELHDRLAELGPPLVSQVLSQLESGCLEPRPQDDAQATQAPRLSKADGTVQFDQPAAAVRARVHGLTPWPGCRVRIGSQVIRLARVDVSEDGQRDGRPGQVLADRTVACAEGSVRLLAVQPPGGRLMSFDAYCRGHDVPAGACFEPL